jgi:glucosamine--fructose-6-phosphate aminotransferase (isomerizing)
MPAERNAHPHVSGEQVAVVHNGIIENHSELKERLKRAGYCFNSETDTEVIAHLLASLLEDNDNLLQVLREAIKELVGAYALAVVSPHEPDCLVACRSGSPLVIGLGVGENFIASDAFALLPVTQRFIFLEEGDIAEIRRDGVTIFDDEGKTVEREVRELSAMATVADKGPYRHYMLKEIFEQPGVISETLEGRIHKGRLLEESFGHETSTLLAGRGRYSLQRGGGE